MSMVAAITVGSATIASAASTAVAAPITTPTSTPASGGAKAAATGADSGGFHAPVVKPGSNQTSLAVTGGTQAVTAPCANPVACENALPGDPKSDWDVDEPGDLSIQGFATDQSVNVGGTVTFKINTPVTSYHIDILRFGWYGGLGARKVVSNMLPTAQLPQTQPACVVDNTNTTGLIDCGNWAASASWAVPSTAVSGIYAAHLVRNDTGGDSLIFFVVRNDASHSAIVYQSSDVTREAYNQYGGNSLYSCTVACPPGNPLGYKGAYQVSFNRPNTAVQLGEQYSFFGAEFQMVEFLEANGYDTSYISGVDTDRAGTLLKNHKVYMDSGHDEYWSAAQRTNVTAARDAGVNLAFFSGNEMFWKTRYLPSVDGSSTSYRTLVTYKETHFNAKVDPQPSIWTGTWRDPRFAATTDGGKPENGLTGTAFVVDPPNSFAIQVPAANGKARLWRNTTAATLAPGKVDTLAPNTMGYEWDADLDNGFRPAGLIDLSSTTENVTNLMLDYGSIEGPGTATHSLTMYKAASGALVFGAGTVQWSWGLEGSPDGTAPPNKDQMQATVNLFADMKVQPTTLLSTLVAATASTDVTAPRSTITSPAAGAVVADGTTVTISGTATDTGGVVAGVEVSTDGGSTWHPAVGMGSWTYSWKATSSGSINIKTRATDDSGNIETPAAGRTVTVNCPCQIFASSQSPHVADSGDNAAVEVGVKFRATVDGYVSGVRFYKSAANTGTHIGSLWSSTGQLLAQATFTSETATGWQQVTFQNAVHVSANTTYVASYHTPTGHYADDTGVGTNPSALPATTLSGQALVSKPLVALQSSSDTSATTNVDGPNGVFSYGANSTFPSGSFADANYWVDLTFLPSAGAPFIVGQSPAPGATNQTTTAPVTATFSEDVVPSSIVFTLADNAGHAIAGAVTYNSATHTASFTPSAPLTAGTTYTAKVSGAKDAGGNTMVGTTSWSFTTFTCPCSLWPSTTVPSQTDSGDGSAIEVGVRVIPNVNGFMSGVRFYKAVTNTGTHVGSLWSASGSLLAQGTFTGETASGWQTLSFASPIPVTAGTTYVVSYHTNTGHYAQDSGYFTSTGVNSGPVQAPADGAGGGHNGLYQYSAGSAFPTNTFTGTNYWVDTVFATQGPTDTTPPTVTTKSPAAGATNVAINASVSATFSEAVQGSSISFVLKDASGTTLPSTLSYNVGTLTATITPNAPLVVGVTYTATVSGATDIYGNVMTVPVTWSFTTSGALCPCTLFPASATPAVLDDSDATGIELGTRFTADHDGLITGIRFYKGPTNTGTHVGNLWSSTGTLLATGVFNSETASGWQELDFSNSIAVTANTVYVVSYHTNVGKYSETVNYFTAQYDNSPLHAPATANGGNGVYAVGPGGFPTQTFSGTNYWVDAVYNTTGPPVRTTPPVVSSTSPAAGSTGVPQTAQVTATFDEAVQPSSVTLTLTGNGGASVPGSMNYNSVTQTATFTPNTQLTVATTYTASVQATDLAGNAMPAPTTWTFSTGTSLCPCSVWSDTTTPGNDRFG